MIGLWQTMSTLTEYRNQCEMVFGGASFWNSTNGHSVLMVYYQYKQRIFKYYFNCWSYFAWVKIFKQKLLISMIFQVLAKNIKIGRSTIGWNSWSQRPAHQHIQNGSPPLSSKCSQKPLNIIVSLKRPIKKTMYFHI